VHVSDNTFIVTGMASLQNTSPVQTENENGKASTVQCKTDPVEVEEQISC